MSTRLLGEPNIPVLRVEDDGRVLRGVALPFGEPAIVQGPKGSLVEEVMDPESIARIASNLPLLVSHDRDRPAAGVVRTAAVTERGAMVEAELVGSDDELEGWRRRFREGLSAALSIGFTRDARRTQYEAPRREGALPRMRPRGVVVHEVSLCQWAAYPSASVVSLSVRSAADQDRHEESQRTIVETRVFLSQLAARQARRRGG